MEEKKDKKRIDEFAEEMANLIYNPNFETIEKDINDFVNKYPNEVGSLKKKKILHTD